MIEDIFDDLVVMDSNLSNELKQAVERSHLSLRQISRYSGCNVSTLSRAVNDLVPPSRPMLITWCNVLREHGGMSQSEMDMLLELEYKEATSHRISIQSQQN